MHCSSVSLTFKGNKLLDTSPSFPPTQKPQPKYLKIELTQNAKLLRLSFDAKLRTKEILENELFQFQGLGSLTVSKKDIL